MEVGELLLVLPDQIVALGEVARQIKHAFSGNGHWSEMAQKVMEELANAR